MPDIYTILEQNKDNFDEVVSKLCVDTKDDRDPQAYLDEYKGQRTRREESVDNREDKKIDVYSDTETVKDEVTGEEIPKKIGFDTVVVAKVKTNYPKKIVRVAANFLFGGDMSITFGDSNKGTEYFRKVWEKKLRMKSIFKKFARTVMIETKAALLFYPRPNAEGNLDIKVKILSIKNGEIFPHFDAYGDMDAFIRKYTSNSPVDDKECDFIDIYLSEKTINAYKQDGQWVKTETPNLAGLIPVVYSDIDAPEWEDEVTALDKIENRLSRLIDTNDYISEPILKSYGATNLPNKKTVGKQIEFDMAVDPDTGKTYHGDAEYLTWQQTVESIRLELDELKNEILSGTSTPDLTFDNMKGLGNLSGVAIKLMFMDAFLKREDNMEVFEPVVSRCISVVRNMMCNVTDVVYRSQLEDVDIDVEFGSVLPDDLREEIEILSLASGGKPVNSQKTLVGRSRFTKDPKEEYKQLQKESNESMVGMTIGGY